MSRSQSGSGVTWWIVGGIRPLVIASAHAAPSTAPAAPSIWPVIDLVDETATSCAWSPSTALIATVSDASFNGVEVPCALMYVTSLGSSPAPRSAHPTPSVAPEPFGSGAVMWCASSDAPYPATSQYIRAPRARACSSDSRISDAPPSDRTNPSRLASNGREAVSGSGFFVSAVIWANAATVNGTVAASEP